MTHGALPVVLIVSAAITALAACGVGGRTQVPTTRPPSPVEATADRPSGCPVTPPNHHVPPGQANNPGAADAPYLGNGRLWTVLSEDGIVREAQDRDGSIRQKFPWWRGVRGALRITGNRVDASAPPLRAHVPDGYGPTGFQSSALIFPMSGCWRVTGTAAGASLTFVTLVVGADA